MENYSNDEGHEPAIGKPHQSGRRRTITAEDLARKKRVHQDSPCSRKKEKTCCKSPVVFVKTTRSEAKADYKSEN